MRTLIDHSIGPVWEANHVWLIYVLVMWWTGFPESFAATMTTLAVPMMLALLGIVLRGASFAFRKYAATLGQARLFGVVFAGSSLITPFFLGAAVGAIASGRVPADGGGDLFASWITTTSLLGGAIAVGTCSFLAGTFLTADAQRAAKPRAGRAAAAADHRRRRRHRCGRAGGLLPLRADAPTLYDGLSGRAAPLVLISAAAGLATLWLLWRRRFAVARFTAVAAVASVVLGWGLGQYPWLLVDEVRIEDAAGASATLTGLLVAVGLAGVIVVPALSYLFWLTQTEPWTREDHGEDATVRPG